MQSTAGIKLFTLAISDIVVILSPWMSNNKLELQLNTGADWKGCRTGIPVIFLKVRRKRVRSVTICETFKTLCTLGKFWGSLRGPPNDYAWSLLSTWKQHITNIIPAALHTYSIHTTTMLRLIAWSPLTRTHCRQTDTCLMVSFPGQLG